MKRTRIRILVTLLALGIGATSASAADTAFFRDLLQKEKASYSDAVRVMSILIAQEDRGETFDVQRKELIEMGWVPDDWTYAPDSPVTKGMLSYMVVKALEIQGGLTMRIFGVSQRYAMRECLDLRLLAEGGKTQYVAGGELLAVLRRCEQYQTEQKEKAAGKTEEPAEVKAEEKKAEPVKVAPPKTESAKTEPEQVQRQKYPWRQGPGRKPGRPR